MWIVGVSLLITVISIANALLMSVTERFREIGTLKCLGALSRFVVKLFLIESSFTGLVGSLIGSVGGAVLALMGYAYIFGLTPVLTSVDFGALALAGLGCVGVGVVLSVVAGIYPARVAARMIPAMALSSHV
jgi:ABC-type antimicrobial peptide transport system permease subunit